MENRRGALSMKVIIWKMEMATRVQILDNAVCILIYANALGKGINLSVLLLATTDWVL